MNAARDNIFDSSPLSAFCAVGRLDLLEARFSGRAQWAIEVYDEIARGVPDTPVLSDVLTASWLPEAIRSLAVDEIERLRLALGGKARDRRHLGEAASIVIATAQGYVVVLDDRDATRLAQARGVGTTSTVAILREFVHAGVLTANDAQDLLYAMIDDHGRRLPRLGIGDLS
jgi:predicted nucleic acid-binding protein